MSLNNAITLRILQLCKESGLTINGLSYRCGITQSTIVNITGGRNKSATISTIQDREYVNKQDKRLVPTALGEVVTGLMLERFNDIIDVEFTANMETKLDDVEEGKRKW